MLYQMDNKEPQNCWDFHNCPKDIRDNCVAYKMNLGRKCWAVASYVPEGCPKTYRDFKYCCDCLWFKKLNPKNKK